MKIKTTRNGFLFFIHLFLLINFDLSHAATSPPNVILVTFDGARWREVFHGLDPKLSGGQYGILFSNLLNILSPQGILLGNPWTGKPLKVSAPVVTSLPIYQSIMAGEPQPCRTNDCGRIQVETLPERLIRELKLQPKEVATIASWDAIPLAVEHVSGTVFSNAALNPLDDGTQDPSLADINQLQKADPPPWGGVRYDKHTYAQALRYLKVHQPRFLFISFNDTDEYGHRDNYAGYTSMMRLYDLWLKDLVDTLDHLGEYGKATTLIVSTDHGRGVGAENWKHHAVSIPESNLIWIYGRSPYTRSKPRRRDAMGNHLAIKNIDRKIALEQLQSSESSLYEHIDIRPTVESIFGLKPIDCKHCGRVIKEIVGP